MKQLKYGLPLILFLLFDLQFLGTLVDRNTLTRSAARKILKLAKLPDLKLFRSTIDTLLDNLEMCPQVSFPLTF